MSKKTMAQRQDRIRRETLEREMADKPLAERAQAVWAVRKERRNRSLLQELSKEIRRLGLGDADSEYNGWPAWAAEDVVGPDRRIVAYYDKERGARLSVTEACASPDCDEQGALAVFRDLEGLGAQIEAGALEKDWECPKCNPSEKVAA